ncbi:hypothetical protein PJ267_16955 [Arthrobacter sp. OVS8]|nr:hypothetical protein PJ267_16955 [Arthrobacter sp. OVS8]
MRSAAAGEQRDAVLWSDKCWWAPFPTVPANGNGENEACRPWARATMPTMIFARTTLSAA